ncbi:hypothetical protein ACSBR2_014718 [Camellia fascicularis]
MAGTRREMMINGGNSPGRSTYGRPIPRRGQVKVAIVLEWFSSVESPMIPIPRKKCNSHCFNDIDSLSPNIFIVPTDFES